MFGSFLRAIFQNYSAQKPIMRILARLTQHIYRHLMEIRRRTAYAGKLRNSHVNHVV